MTVAVLILLLNIRIRYYENTPAVSKNKELFLR
jgi:hypothetical protein